MQIGRRDRDIGVLHRIANLGERPASRQSVQDERRGESSVFPNDRSRECDTPCDTAVSLNYGNSGNTLAPTSIKSNPAARRTSGDSIPSGIRSGSNGLYYQRLTSSAKTRRSRMRSSLLRSGSKSCRRSLADTAKGGAIMLVGKEGKGFPRHLDQPTLVKYSGKPRLGPRVIHLPLELRSSEPSSPTTRLCLLRRVGSFPMGLTPSLGVADRRAGIGNGKIASTPFAGYSRISFNNSPPTSVRR